MWTANSTFGSLTAPPNTTVTWNVTWHTPDDPAPCRGPRTVPSGPGRTTRGRIVNVLIAAEKVIGRFVGWAVGTVVLAGVAAAEHVEARRRRRHEGDTMTPKAAR